ncbi:MAG: CHAT domain-containing protein, partial [Qipengyuania sp.]
VAPRLAQPLGTAIDPVSQDAETVRISVPIAQRLNSQARGGLIGFASETTLTESERAQIIDAQALQIAGSAARLMGDGARAREALLEAQQRAMAVRAGRVTTILRMRSQILGDLGLLAESGGNPDEAERYLRASVDLLQTQYPERSAVSGAQARLASYLLRNGQEAEGLAAYEEVVERTLTRGGGGTGFVNLMRPYYRHLAQRADNDPQAASRFFRAAQLLVRPGIAETQAVFARELSAGSDEASRLFRQSTDLAREVEQLRVRYLALTRAEQTAEVAMRANEFKQRIESLEQAQLRTQAQLADFPQYRAVANRAIGLDEFQSLLRPGEAYARLAVAGSDLFMVWSTADRARVWKVPMRQQDLDFLVDMLRASISVQEGDRYVTYPFDLDSSHELFGKLFGPVAADLGAIDHLIFEPDGAMLRLPADLLVADAASLARYETQAAIDEYDFTGVEWLGRDRRISTAVSAQGFADARRAPSSAAAREYIGFGQNQPLGETTVASTRGAIVSGSDSCGWGIATWNQPIDASELWVARSIVGEGASEIETGASFTDTAIKTRQDLDQFRILHFATHGLVTPPHPRCSVQPALLTSFGGEGSDGLLSFDEIFDLDLDADVVILSACDTAAGASIEATREAGLTTGGGTALDGLVRAFVGAGGRTVLASHWPAPDDYRATERLVSEMFRAGQTMPLGAALKQSQHALMDEAVTSHPYYWAGFALVGDGASTQLSRSPQGSAGEAE